ncbi:uncharacterized protein At3g28850-like [Lotus japonicus]|uniref:uncharacterized protein At3g28850-like n=1 Tax=Lotus japonicus TaxID=34305 RepID=UPI0025881E5B|nr:uncharacterized protein At3g28850-like [Lotus japonicus]
MKGVKGKLLKKLKSIKQISSLKAERVLQLKASDGYADFLPKIPSFNLPTPFVSREKHSQKAVQSCENVQEQENIIDVSELMRDLEEEEDMDSDDYNDNKENIVPGLLKSEGNVTILQNKVREETGLKQSGGGVLKEKRSPLVLSSRADGGGGSKRKTPMSEIDISSFRRPDLNSGSLFDPNLLAAFEEALKEHALVTEEQRRARVETESSQNKEDEDEEEKDPLMLFEEKCPPGGETTVIFYTTTLRGIRKTFEDCSKIRFLLQSFKVLYFERDISMDQGFRDELWSILDGKTLPPRLFVKGRYIGGAEEVVTLHEQGKLKKLFEGVPMDYFDGACDACGGVRFVLCFKCNGSHKVIAENEEKESTQCPQCNENGLIVCPYCC